ncbi:MAG TPA: hypothetical protein VKB47_04755, partial [Terracidiphilus sp.]|nr:hypothetical protein [Terracidiphilus sp.]
MTNSVRFLPRSSTARSASRIACEVVRQGQLIPAPQDYGCDAATVYRIVFVLPVKRALSVGPERVNDADV